MFAAGKVNQPTKAKVPLFFSLSFIHNNKTDSFTALVARAGKVNL